MKKTLKIRKRVQPKFAYRDISYLYPLTQEQADARKAQIQADVAPPPAPEVELELKLVQDTRINPDVVHLYVRGIDHPLMQFKVVNERLTFHRISFSNDLSKKDLKIEDRRPGRGHFILSETEEKNFPVSYGWPSSAEAFAEDTAPTPGGKLEYDPAYGRPSAEDLDAAANDWPYVGTGKPRC